MSSPGAVTSGLVLRPFIVTPRDEKGEHVFVLLIEPTPITLAESPGELAVPQPGPEFPIEKTGIIPAAVHAEMTPS